MMGPKKFQEGIVNAIISAVRKNYNFNYRGGQIWIINDSVMITFTPDNRATVKFGQQELRLTYEDLVQKLSNALSDANQEILMKNSDIKQRAILDELTKTLG